MRWQEIINVQATERIEPFLITELLSLFNLMYSTTDLVKADISRQASKPENLTVFLEWDSDAVKKEGSGLSKILRNQLEHYGVVDNSIRTGNENIGQTVH